MQMPARAIKNRTRVIKTIAARMGPDSLVAPPRLLLWNSGIPAKSAPVPIRTKFKTISRTQEQMNAV